jgi:uncharacterized protein (TIGR02466 family)
MNANDIKADVKLAFATPIVTAELAAVAARNAELKALILARSRSHPSTQASNLGGWQSDWTMEQWGGPVLGLLLTAAKSIATNMTRSRQGKPVTVDWRANAWANINRAGQSNEFHIHPAAMWSGTYYVDDAGAADDAAQGGELELLDPRGAAPAMYAPLLAFAGPGGLAVGATETIRPKAGRLVLFPAWLYHQVRPYRGPGERISIAFNLSL